MKTSAPAVRMRLVQAHAAHLGVDAPALANGVRGPRKRHVAQRPARLRSRERPGHRLARDAQIVQALKRRAIEDALARGQARQIDTRGEVARVERGRPDDAADILERFRRRVLHDEARGAIGAAPDDGAVAVDVAGGDAERRGWPCARGGHDARAPARRAAASPAPRPRSPPRAEETRGESVRVAMWVCSLSVVVRVVRVVRGFRAVRGSTS